MKRNLLISLLALLLTAACGGGQSATPLPTPTQIPTYRYVTPTMMVLATEQATEVSAAATVDTEALTQGEGRYVALKCGDCHGENGEGVSDKGPTLIGLSLSEVDFISFLRSGGKLGVAHQFASNRLSAKGAQNLYQYVMSLSS